MTDIELGKRIREYRTQHNLTRSQFAALAGVRRASVGDWENGRVLPTPDNATRLKQLLSTTPTDDAATLTQWTEWTITAKAVALLGRIRTLTATTLTAADVADRPLDAEDFTAALRVLHHVRTEVDRTEIVLLDVLRKKGWTWAAISREVYPDAPDSMAQQRYRRLNRKREREG